MLSPRIARGIGLPFRGLRAVPIRSYASAPSTQDSSSSSSTAAYDPTIPPPPTKPNTGVHVRKYKPITPGIRHVRRPINEHLWKGGPVKRLTFPKKGHSKGGRNNTGKITVHHRGGGHKRRIRMVDFVRRDPGPHTVERIEYDPGRNAHIALVRSQLNKKLSYILAPFGMRAGEVVHSYMSGIPKDLLDSMGGSVDPGVLAVRTAWRGNCLPLHMIPVGTFIFNIGLYPKGRGQLCRAAGTYGTVISKGTQLQQNEEARRAAMTEQERKEEDENTQPMSTSEKDKRRNFLRSVTVRLQSGEVRLLHKDCCATVGISSNPDFRYRQIGKAGRSRWLNRRPTVRGVAKNAADHPHGGGKGKSKGNVDPKTPWGMPVCLSICNHCYSPIPRSLLMIV